MRFQPPRRSRLCSTARPSRRRPRSSSAIKRPVGVYRAAHDTFEQSSGGYWDTNKNLRNARNKTDGDGHFVIPFDKLTDASFTTTAPPAYKGPAKPKPSDFGLTEADVAAADSQGAPKPPKVIAKVPDFIAAAKAEGYSLDFRAQSGSPGDKTNAENDFRERYAKASLALGLNGKLVLGVFALETAGKGRITEQPVNKDGRALSTALGNAQLLAGNSVDVMTNYGGAIEKEIRAEAAAHARAHGNPAAADRLTAKADIRSKSMTTRVSSAMGSRRLGGVPNPSVISHSAWRSTRRTSIPDIGPYMQAHKLADTI